MSIVNAEFFDVDQEVVISLSSLEFLTPLVLLRIAHNFESLNQLISCSEKQLVERGLSAETARQIARRPSDVTKQQALMKKHGIRLIYLDNAEYPALLKEISDPPLWLYIRGELPKGPALTVVGTRKPTPYASTVMTDVLSTELLKKVMIISGLAYGVDKKAHELALGVDGKTVAVLAGGLDVIYPIAHVQLAEAILQAGGALISEYPPLSRPLPYRFPVRNRIIAGLSPLTLIIEAAIKSGTLTTAKAALDYNRDVAAIPGDITKKQSEGGNLLIKKGAMLIDSPADLNEYYGIKDKKNTQLVDKSLQELLNLLSTGSKTVDELVVLTASGIETILSQLTELELLSLVYQTSPGCYAANKK